MTSDEPTPAEPIEIRCEETIGLNLKEALGLHKEGPDSEVLVVVEHDWRAGGEIEQGTITRATAEGAPSEGEANSLPCAGRFVSFLRSQRETWWDDLT